MNIVIIGAGRTGSYLAKILSEEQHNITVIDIDNKRLEKLSRSADIAIQFGSGTDLNLLENILEEKVDLFVALSSSDEVNLTSCLLAKNLGVHKTVARVRSKSFLDKSLLDIQRLFKIDHLLGTSILVAHDIVKAVLNPGSLFVETFAHGAAQLRTLKIPAHSKYTGKRLHDIDFEKNLLIALIKRKNLKTGTTEIIFPKGSDILFEGDEISIIGEIATMQHLNALFGTQVKQTQSAFIVGGSKIAEELIPLLEALKVHVKIVEKEEEKANALSHAFPNATVILQDGTDYSFLVAEKVHLSDVFIACSRSDETNILAAFLARKAGAPAIITVVSDTTYVPILKELGIAYVLSEKITVSNRIHSMLYEKSLVSVSSLYENAAKIFEVKVSSQSQIVGIPLVELRKQLPSDFLIGIIENRGRIVIPRGSNILTPGDTAVIISSPKHLRELEALF